METCGACGGICGQSKNGVYSALDLPFFIVSASYHLCHVAESTAQCRILKMVLFTEKLGQNCFTFLTCNST